MHSHPQHPFTDNAVSCETAGTVPGQQKTLAQPRSPIFVEINEYSGLTSFELQVRGGGLKALPLVEQTFFFLMDLGGFSRWLVSALTPFLRIALFIFIKWFWWSLLRREEE